MTGIGVFDACALIAYLKGEPGRDVVAELLQDKNLTHLAHGLNVGEVYSSVLNAADDATAAKAIGLLVSDGITIRNDFDDIFWRDAATWKSTLSPRPSYADCFCLAFALRVHGEVVTSDHKHFDSVASDSICPVRFIR